MPPDFWQALACPPASGDCAVGILEPKASYVAGEGGDLRESGVCVRPCTHPDLYMAREFPGFSASSSCSEQKSNYARPRPRTMVSCVVRAATCSSRRPAQKTATVANVETTADSLPREGPPNFSEGLKPLLHQRLESQALVPARPRPRPVPHYRQVLSHARARASEPESCRREAQRRPETLRPSLAAPTRAGPSGRRRRGREGLRRHRRAVPVTLTFTRHSIARASLSNETSLGQSQASLSVKGEPRTMNSLRAGTSMSSRGVALYVLHTSLWLVV